MNTDAEFEEVTIEKVSASGDGHTLGRSDGFCFYCPPISDGYLPMAGDVARFYGRGIGAPVRGLVVNGHVAFYRTPAEQEAKFQDECRAREQEKRDTFDANRLKMDAEFDALPAVFQKRIARFRANQPDFRWKHEAYEMSVCVDAVKMAEALKTPEVIKSFHGMKWEEQQAAVPGLFDGHSGNTFGYAVRLAHHYVTEPDNVWLDHAAISALVGCEEAGCLPVPESEWPEHLRTPPPPEAGEERK